MDNSQPRVLIHQGAEAKLYKSNFLGKPILIKERFQKKYRHPKLDETLTKERTKAEAKAMVKCRKLGIYTPTVYMVDVDENSIYMEHIADCITVREAIETTRLTKNDVDSNNLKLKSLSEKIGAVVAILHANSIIHGDLTTSNMLLSNDKLVLIDFGLSHVDPSLEDKGVDLYVLEKAILATHPNSEEFFADILSTYKEKYLDGSNVLTKLDEVRMRGRKRSMVG